MVQLLTGLKFKTIQIILLKIVLWKEFLFYTEYKSNMGQFYEILFINFIEYEQNFGYSTHCKVFCHHL